MAAQAPKPRSAATSRRPAPAPAPKRKRSTSSAAAAAGRDGRGLSRGRPAREEEPAAAVAASSSSSSSITSPALMPPPPPGGHGGCRSLIGGGASLASGSQPPQLPEFSQLTMSQTLDSSSSGRPPPQPPVPPPPPAHQGEHRFPGLQRRGTGPGQARPQPQPQPQPPSSLGYTRAILGLLTPRRMLADCGRPALPRPFPAGSPGTASVRSHRTSRSSRSLRGGGGERGGRPPSLLQMVFETPQRAARRLLAAGGREGRSRSRARAPPEGREWRTEADSNAADAAADAVAAEKARAQKARSEAEAEAEKAREEAEETRRSQLASLKKVELQLDEKRAAILAQMGAFEAKMKGREEALRVQEDEFRASVRAARAKFREVREAEEEQIGSTVRTTILPRLRMRAEEVVQHVAQDARRAFVRDARETAETELQLLREEGGRLLASGGTPTSIGGDGRPLAALGAALPPCGEHEYSLSSSSKSPAGTCDVKSREQKKAASHPKSKIAPPFQYRAPTSTPAISAPKQGKSSTRRTYGKISSRRALPVDNPTLEDESSKKRAKAGRGSRSKLNVSMTDQRTTDKGNVAEHSLVVKVRHPVVSVINCKENRETNCVTPSIVSSAETAKKPFARSARATNSRGRRRKKRARHGESREQIRGKTDDDDAFTFSQFD